MILRRPLVWYLLTAATLAVSAGCATREVPVPVPVPAPPASSATSTTPPTTGTTQAAEEQDDGSEGADGTVARCRLDDLRATTEGPEGSGSQQQVRVVWANASTQACRMAGFGGVDLVVSPGSEERYSLPRRQTDAESFRLAPGETAHSTITFLPADAGGQNAYRATKIWATPPDETHSVLLDWPAGPVLRQDGATRPGTYLGPVSPGTG